MEKSHFDAATLLEKAAALRAEGRCRSWLPGVVEELSRASDTFPYEEDSDRYTIEYIYPH
jgi:hypothetical protein